MSEDLLKSMTEALKAFGPVQITTFVSSRYFSSDKAKVFETDGEKIVAAGPRFWEAVLKQTKARPNEPKPWYNGIRIVEIDEDLPEFTRVLTVIQECVSSPQ